MSFEPRKTCSRCERPATVCYCTSIRPLQTRTRVVILQHPREEGMPIGTARMASLSLPNSLLRVGVSFEHDPLVVRELEHRGRSALLLYPGPGARPVTDFRNEPATLVVLDGTWWQSKKLLKQNPRIAALPRVALSPERPSEYRIRREPAAEYVSTIEALRYALSDLEGDGARFEPLLAPFRLMVDMQLAHHGAAPRSATVRVRRPRAKQEPALVRRLRDQLAELVLVGVEADSYPYEMPGRPEERLIQLVGYRPASGEALEVVVDPGRELAPGTLRHSGLDAGLLAHAVQRADAFARFTAFARGGLVAGYGDFPRRVAGDAVGPGYWDLRPMARQLFGGESLEVLCDRLGLTPSPVPGSGRAPRRLGALWALLAFRMAEGERRDRERLARPLGCGRAAGPSA